QVAVVLAACGQHADAVDVLPDLGLVPVGGPLPVRVVAEPLGVGAGDPALAAQPVTGDTDVVVVHADAVAVGVDEAALEQLAVTADDRRDAVPLGQLVVLPHRGAALPRGVGVVHRQAVLAAAEGRVVPLHEDDLALAAGVAQLLLAPAPLRAAGVEVRQVGAARGGVLRGREVVLRVGAGPAVLATDGLVALVVLGVVVGLADVGVERDDGDRAVVDPVVVVAVLGGAVVRAVEVGVVLRPGADDDRAVLRRPVAAVDVAAEALPVAEGGQHGRASEPVALGAGVVSEPLVPARLVATALHEVAREQEEVGAALVGDGEVGAVPLVLGERVAQHLLARQRRDAEGEVPRRAGDGVGAGQPGHLAGRPLAPGDPAARLGLVVGHRDEGDALPVRRGGSGAERPAIAVATLLDHVGVVRVGAQPGHLDDVLDVAVGQQPGAVLEAGDLLGALGVGVAEDRHRLGRAGPPRAAPQPRPGDREGAGHLGVAD